MAGRLNYLHPIPQIILLIIIALVSALLLTIVGMVVAIPIFGLEMFGSMFTGNVQNMDIGFLKYLQLLQGIGMFVVPAFITAALISKRPLNFLWFGKKVNFKSVLLTIVMIYAVVPLINLTGMWNSNLQLPEFMSGIENWMTAREEQAAIITEKFVQSEHLGQMLFNIFLIAVIPAIGEELFFRGVIQTVLAKWFKNYHVAIFTAAFVFSFFHLQFYGFLPRFILGVLFGYLLVWSGNIWLPILAHFINNATAVVAYHFMGKGAISVDPEAIGTDSAFGWMAILSIVIVVASLLAIRVYEFKKKIEVNI